MSTPRTPAVGGEREVPVPDPIARDYLLLALRLDQRIAGLVDGYFGPADLKARVDTEQLRPPSGWPTTPSPCGRAPRRRSPSPTAGAGSTPSSWRSRCRPGRSAGDGLPVPRARDGLLRLTARSARRRRSSTARRPSSRRCSRATGPLAARIVAWDERFTIPVERVRGVVDALLPGFRRRAETLFGLPAGEGLAVSLVRDQPWSGYNWYDGGRRSRVDLNTDLPIRVADLLAVLPHETYPGHHLEHAWHEAHLVDGLGRMEASVLCINAPECLLSEGLADLGRRFAVPPGEEADLLVEVYRLAGLPGLDDPAAVREAAERQVAITRALTAVRGVAGNAALMLHADGVPRDEVLAYLERRLLSTPERAAKRLEFITHPLWRTYVFVYFEGERLLRRWLELVPEAEQPARFRRLLAEQLTPVGDRRRDLGGRERGLTAGGPAARQRGGAAARAGTVIPARPRQRARSPPQPDHQAADRPEADAPRRLERLPRLVADEHPAGEPRERGRDAAGECLIKVM